jgi:hypothetical protein
VQARARKTENKKGTTITVTETVSQFILEFVDNNIEDAKKT